MTLCGKNRFIVSYCTAVGSILLIPWSLTHAIASSNASAIHAKHKRNLTEISWTHGANSIDKLRDAMNSQSMMIEADVIMGRNSPGVSIPIMANPPTRTTDLTFDDFLTSLIKHNKAPEDRRKGIKLDFKRNDCIEPVMKKLHEKQHEIDFPVWLHGDVLRGPVEAILTPLDGPHFLNMSKQFYPQGMLSLGWTTRYGGDDSKFEATRSKHQKIIKGRYTQNHINEMVKLWEEFNEKSDSGGPPVTFSVRAGIASQSVDVLVVLLGKIGSQSTITLWSQESDPVTITEINQLIETIGYDRVYCDLPFTLNSDPNVPNLSGQHSQPDNTLINQGSVYTKANYLTILVSLHISFFAYN